MAKFKVVYLDFEESETDSLTYNVEADDEYAAIDSWADNCPGDEILRVIKCDSQ